MVPDFLQIVKVAVTNGRRLTLQWPLIRNIRSKEEVDACSYLTHVFGYDTEGSLFHILKQTGIHSICMVFFYVI